MSSSVPETASPASTKRSPRTPGREAAEEFVIDVRGGAFATPATIETVLSGGVRAGGEETVRVAQRSTVALRWRSDQPAELHLHGYDIEAEIGPGHPVTMLFRADFPGRFPAELHGAAGEAVVLYLEVRP